MSSCLPYSHLYESVVAISLVGEDWKTSVIEPEPGPCVSNVPEKKHNRFVPASRELSYHIVSYDIRFDGSLLHPHSLRVDDQRYQPGLCKTNYSHHSLHRMRTINPRSGAKSFQHLDSLMFFFWTSFIPQWSRDIWLYGFFLKTKVGWFTAASTKLFILIFW